MSSSKYEIVNKYNRENYFKVAIRIPKEKKAIIDEVSLKEEKSINRLFIEAFEKNYKVDLSTKQNYGQKPDYRKYINKKVKTLKELGYENVQELRYFLESVVDDKSENNIDNIDAAYSAILNSNYNSKAE